MASIRRQDPIGGEGQVERNARALETAHLMKDVGFRIARGGALAIVSQLARMLLQFLSLVVLARLLGPSDFGLVAMAGTVIALAGLFTDLGLSAATVQRKELDQDIVSALFAVNLGAGLLLMLVAWATAPLAAWALNEPRVLWVIGAMAVALPLNAGAAQNLALLTRGMKWAELQTCAVLSQAIGTGAALILAWQFNAGYWALVWQTLLAGLANLVLAFSFCGWRPSRVSDWRGARSALRFGLELTGFNFTNYFHRQIDNVLIGWRWGAVELGHYSRAYSLMLLPNSLFSGPIASAVTPALSRLQSDPAKWRRTYLRALNVLTILGAWTTSMLLISPELLVRIVFGAGWGRSAEILYWLFGTLLASVPAGTCGWALTSLGRSRDLLHWGLFASSIFLSAFVLGLNGGAVGVARAYFFAMNILAPIYFLYSLRGTEVSVPDVLANVLPGTLTAVFALALGRVIVPAEDGGDFAIVLLRSIIVVLPFAALIGITVWRDKVLSAAVASALHQARRRLRGGEVRDG